MTTTEFACYAAPYIEEGWSEETRMAIYFALRGWISPNSRINFLYGAYAFLSCYDFATHNLPARRDLFEVGLYRNIMLVYIKDKGVLEKLQDDYFDFVHTAERSTETVIDWLSLFRTQHPDLVYNTFLLSFYTFDTFYLV